MTQPLHSPSLRSSQRRLPAALGWAGAALLAASLALPYWQARLFAPQYRNGLTATMYAWRVSGDVDEIDELNHYIGMRRLGELAKAERASAVPAVLLLALFCAYAWKKKDRRLTGLAALGASAFPAGFVADMAFWMRYSTSHLDPTAPLKIRQFSIPVFGTGRVAQFHSEFWPMPGFYLALAAAALLVAAWRLLLRKHASGARGSSLPRAAGVTGLLLALGAAGARAESLQARIDKAAAGSEIELAAGTYEGPLTIAKSLTLRGRGSATVLSAGGRGTVATIKAPGVVLEDLTLAHSGESLLFEDAGLRVEAASAAVRRCFFEDVLFGVFLVNARGAVIEDSRFKGKPLDMGRRGDLVRSWNSDQITVRGNVMEGGRDFVLWFSTGSRVEANTLSRGRYGLHFMYTNNASVEGNRFIGNSVGFYVMYSQKVAIRRNRFERQRGPSGAGLGLKESDWITVEDNDFIGNRQGVYIDGSPLLAEHVNEFSGNAFVRNDIGMSILPGVSGNVLSGNAFDDNLQQVSKRGGGQLTGNRWQKDGRGNFWDDYAGYGPAGSRVGRIPYRVESAWESLMDRQPLARFFTYTPAAQAVELASRAFPVFRPKAVLSDERPLLRAPVDASRSQSPSPSSWGVPAALASFSGLLFGLPALLRRRRAARPQAPPPSSSALDLRGVRKSFGGRGVLGGVDARLEPGRTLVLWGSNGAGKSTLIRCVLGLLEFEGRISVFGRDCLLEGREARSLLGYVAQEFAGYDWTVRHAMSFIADLRGVERAGIAPALERCGLSGQLDKRVCDLSGGMKQKLALAQALLPDPPLLVLDEPCSNLDPASRKDLLGILRALKGGRAILMTSHRAEEVEALADDILWLEEGRPSRLMSAAEFAEAMASRRPLWVELERPEEREAAISFLISQSRPASPNGTGLWVEAEASAALSIVRTLERRGFAVRNIRREGAL